MTEPPVTSPDLYRPRRARVLEALGPRAAMVLAAAPELSVGADTELKYVVDPDLYYLTGYTEPQAVAVLCPANADAPFTLFVRPRDAERETWTGARGGEESATTQFGASAAYSIDRLQEELPKLLTDVDTIYARLAYGRPDVEAVAVDALVRGRRRRQRTGKGPRAIVDPGTILDEMRLLKEDAEIAWIRAAAELSAAAFRDAAAIIREGSGEWQIEARLDAGFRARGASGPAFPTIVASGPNATVLHHTANDRVLRSGELVLIDAGARAAMYCADITRTFPVSGTFTPAQRVLYDVVLAAHDAAIDAVRPGVTVADVHRAALVPLLDGLIDLGFLQGKVDELVEKEDEFKALYPHKTTHWLGLDVHDAGTYVVDGEPRELRPGMVFTIEPGIYVRPDCTTGPAELRGTGIRIEDDVLVTAAGHEVLTAALPADAAGVESLLR